MACHLIFIAIPIHLRGGCYFQLQMKKYFSRDVLDSGKQWVNSRKITEDQQEEAGMVKRSGGILVTKSSQMVQNHLLTTSEGFLSLQEYMLVILNRSLSLYPISQITNYSELKTKCILTQIWLLKSAQCNLCCSCKLVHVFEAEMLTLSHLDTYNFHFPMAVLIQVSYFSNKTFRLPHETLQYEGT